MCENSRPKLLLLVAFIALAEVFIYSQQQTHLSIQNFNKQEYNAESQNWSITVNQEGYIYAANNAGLLEFDGIEWIFYPAPNGTVIRSVAVDSQGRVFTSGYREIGYWERDIFGNLNYQSLNQKAEALFSPNEEFWTTLITDNRVYFHSFSSIFIYDYDSFKVVRPDAMISSVSEIENQLYIHISQRGMYTLEDTVLTPILPFPQLMNAHVYFVTSNNDGSLLIGTESSGLFIYKENDLRPFLVEWKEYFSKYKINRGAVSNNGNIIIGTLLGGVLIFDKKGNLLSHINNTNGLQNNTVLGIDCDAENNIWLSLDKGLDFLSFTKDSSYTFYQHDEVGAVYAATIHMGYLYLSTNQGVFYRKWKNENERFRIIQGTQGQAWSCDVYEDQLIVSHNAGCFRIKDNIAEEISAVPGGFNLIMDPVNKDFLIQSTYSNIVFYENVYSNWQYSYQLPGFNDLIRYIEFDHHNNLWATHMHRGIYKLHLNDSHDSIINSQYFGDSIFGQEFDIQVFTIENRIVFTTGRKIYTYNDLDNSIILFESLNDSLGKFAESHRVIAAPDHHYWFISKSGIALFRFFNNCYEKIKEYPIELFKDHLIMGYENIYPINSKEAILCLDNGYAILRADEPDLSGLIKDRKLYVKNIETKGPAGKNEYLPIDQNNIRVPFKKRNLTMSFAFPLYSGEELEFQSYIEGLDVQWSTPLDKPIFSFDRIPPGEYQIRVRAFNKWNMASINDQFTLHVASPWYLTKVSFLVYASVIGFLLLGVRYYFIRRIRNRERRIRDGKEKELIKLRNEKLNAELSFRSQELANSTMSIIKKNEFLMNLKETVKRQKDDLGTRYPDKYFYQLTKKIDNNISSMDDWKVFEFHFEKAHEKFLQKLRQKYPDLNHGDLRLCAYLRMNLTSKEIAPLLRISVRGVENHRYKLRKKLNLKPDENLTDFIMAI